MGSKNHSPYFNGLFNVSFQKQNKNGLSNVQIRINMQIGDGVTCTAGGANMKVGTGSPHVLSIEIEIRHSLILSMVFWKGNAILNCIVQVS